ncbi:MAG: hypothetical protein ABH873_00650 [Candidatus Firestonebacteria bacterium]
MGFTNEGKPLHFVLGNIEEEKVLIITMYRPKIEKWIDFLRRKICVQCGEKYFDAEVSRQMEHIVLKGRKTFNLNYCACL